MTAKVPAEGRDNTAARESKDDTPPNADAITVYYNRALDRVVLVVRVDAQGVTGEQQLPEREGK